MKAKNALVSAAILFFAASCGGNSTKEKETTTADSLNNNVPGIDTMAVPDNLRVSFQQQYPSVTDAKWGRYEPIGTFDWEWSGWPVMDSTGYMVRFNSDSMEHLAWYDRENNWVGTVSTITNYTGLPAPVNKTIMADFPGYSIAAVDREKDRSRTAYGVVLTKGNERMKALINEDGRLIKKKKA